MMFKKSQHGLSDKEVLELVERVAALEAENASLKDVAIKRNKYIDGILRGGAKKEAALEQQVSALQQELSEVYEDIDGLKFQIEELSKARPEEHADNGAGEVVEALQALRRRRRGAEQK